MGIRDRKWVVFWLAVGIGAGNVILLFAVLPPLAALILGGMIWIAIATAAYDYCEKGTDTIL